MTAWRQQHHVSVYLPGWCTWCRSQRPPPRECVRPLAEQSGNNKHTHTSHSTCVRLSRCSTICLKLIFIIKLTRKQYILKIAFEFFPVLIISAYLTSPKLKEWIQRYHGLQFKGANTQPKATRKLHESSKNARPPLLSASIKEFSNPDSSARGKCAENLTEGAQRQGEKGDRTLTTARGTEDQRWLSCTWTDRDKDRAVSEL